MDAILTPGERLEDLHRNGLQIIQNPELFCFGQDAVLLSWFARAEKNEKALDLCTGNGIIPILMSAKNDCRHYEALELLPESADAAIRSVRLNGLESKINVTRGDVKEADKLYSPSSFDVITVNPPYMNENGGIVNPSAPKAIARHEIACTLRDIISQSARLLRYGGRLYMIHRPTRLVDVFCCMREMKIEPKKLLFVRPREGKPPVSVLIEGARGGKPQLSVLNDLIIFDGDTYSKEAADIYYG